MRKFIIEDEAHAEGQEGYQSLEEAVLELVRLSSIPWDKEPNQAPCGNWKNCGRRYEIIEYDTLVEPWNEIRRIPALKISANAVLWTPAIRELSKKVESAMRDKFNDKFAAVREILMEDWDPIGVNDVVEARDEYDDYVNQVLSMEAQGASTKEVADHLAFVAKELMGLDPNLDTAQKAATKISDVLKK